MKKSIPLLALLFLVTLMMFIPSFVSADVEEKIEEVFSLANDGDVYLKNMDAKSVSGRIRSRGKLNPAGIYEFHTVSGRIKLAIPSDSEFELKTKTTSGSIDSDFDISLSGRIDRNNLRSVVGKGDAQISMSSVSGSI